jgi:hypothetical protein
MASGSKRGAVEVVFAGISTRLYTIRYNKPYASGTFYLEVWWKQTP